MSSKLLVAIGFCALLEAHDPITTKITWTQEISRIVQNRCQSCHDAKTQIPLTTYEQARPWAKAMRDRVLNRQCPPWGAVKGIGEFLHDPSLTTPEIDRIVEWVEGGAPEGDSAYLPPPRKTAQTKESGKILTISKSITIATPTTYDAIHPAAACSVSAIYPDGRVEQLIWLREFHSLTYWFRNPLVLPAKTRLQVSN